MQLPKKALRRNHVVVLKTGGFYGRVIRMLPDGTVFWLCGGLHFRISKPEDLETGYKGCPIRRGTNYDVKAFSFVTSLRRLKKKAQQFHYEYAHNTPLDYHFIQRM